MNFLEKDLEEIIYGADRELLAEKGLRINGKLFKQLRIGNYGIADLVTVEKTMPVFQEFPEDYGSYQAGDKELISESELIITVYELKKENIGISAFLQAVGYARGIYRYMYERNDIAIIFKIVLIGKSIDTNSAYSYLSNITPYANGDEFLVNYTYSYGVNGIEFKERSGFKLINEGF